MITGDIARPSSLRRNRRVSMDVEFTECRSKTAGAPQFRYTGVADEKGGAEPRVDVVSEALGKRGGLTLLKWAGWVPVTALG